MNGTGPVRLDLGDAGVVGDQGPDVLPEARAVDPLGHSVRGRSLLVGPAQEVRRAATGTTRAARKGRARSRGGEQNVDVAPLAQQHVAVVKKIGGTQFAVGIALADVVDVGAPLLDGTAGVAAGLGQPGAHQGVDQGQAGRSARGEGMSELGASSVTARSISSLSPAMSSLNRAAEASSHLATSASPCTSATTERARAFWAARRSGCSAVSASRAVMSAWAKKVNYRRYGAHVGIFGVEEELVEREGAGARRIEPDRPGLGLAELGAVGLEQQRRGEAVGLVRADARMSSTPIVMLPHWSLPPDLQLAPVVAWRWRKSYACSSM